LQDGKKEADARLVRGGNPQKKKRNSKLIIVKEKKKCESAISRNRGWRIVSKNKLGEHCVQKTSRRKKNFRLYALIRTEEKIPCQGLRHDHFMTARVPHALREGGSLNSGSARCQKRKGGGKSRDGKRKKIRIQPLSAGNFLKKGTLPLGKKRT